MYKVNLIVITGDKSYDKKESGHKTVMVPVFTAYYNVAQNQIYLQFKYNYNIYCTSFNKVRHPVLAITGYENNDHFYGHSADCATGIWIHSNKCDAKIAW